MSNFLDSFKEQTARLVYPKRGKTYWHDANFTLFRLYYAWAVRAYQSRFALPFDHLLHFYLLQARIECMKACNKLKSRNAISFLHGLTMSCCGIPAGKFMHQDQL